MIGDRERQKIYDTSNKLREECILGIQISYSSADYAWHMRSSIYCKFGETKIWNFRSHILVKQNIASFHISMDDGWDTSRVKIFDSWNKHKSNTVNIERSFSSNPRNFFLSYKPFAESSAISRRLIQLILWSGNWGPANVYTHWVWFRLELSVIKVRDELTIEVFFKSPIMHEFVHKDTLPIFLTKS